MKAYANELHQIIQESQPWLAGITEEQAQSVPGTRWMIKEIVGHLIDSACNNHQRFIRLQQGNLMGFPGYDQDHWVDAAGYRTMPWQAIRALWITYNEILVKIIENIHENSRMNYRDKPEQTLEFLVKDYLRHVRHHLSVIQNAI